MISEQMQQYIQEVWPRLPRAVQQAILEEKYISVTEQVADSLGVPKQSINALQLEVLFILLGLETLDALEETLSTKFGLSKELSTTCVDGLGADFFDPLVSEQGVTTSNKQPGQLVGATSIRNAIDAYGLVKERLGRLPQAVQETIRSTELETALSALIQKHMLDENLAPVFVAEAVRVMVGLTTTNNFKTEVTRVAHMEPNKLDALFLDAESQLFKPVRMAIIKALEQRQGAGGGSVPKPPTPPTQTNAPQQDPYREPV